MKKLALLLLIFVQSLVFAQDKQLAKQIIDSLGSPYFHGRAYCTKGDSLAANYIVSLFEKFKVKPIKNSYFQRFSLQKNCITDTVRLILGGKQLALDKDYIIWGFTPSINGNFRLKYVSKPQKWQKLANENLDSVFLVVDSKAINKLKKNKRQVLKAFMTNRMQAAGIIILQDRFYYVPFTEQRPYALIFMKHQVYKRRFESISLSVRSKVKTFETRNIVGYIPGQIDSFVVFTAHYDHLGVLGQVYFPGANDNASGTAMVLSLAHRFSNRKTPPKYNVGFILFSGEEMGLLGSIYYVQHQLIPPEKIKLVINLDMVGSGDEGITIVNGKDMTAVVDKIQAINKQMKLLPDIKLRPNAADSDHYPFTRVGIPAIFIYTRGQYKEYHSITDRPDLLPLNKFNELEKLLYTLEEKL